MNEAEWFACTDPVEMLVSLPGDVSDRKLRLFACACCRHLQDWIDEEVFLDAVETAERFADGQGSKAALKRARQSVRAVRHRLPTEEGKANVEWVALWLVEVTASENAFGKVAHEIRRLGSEGLLMPDEQPAAGELLRCIFGKGNRLQAGDLVYGRFWNRRWVGEGDPDPFSRGHMGPKTGDLVRAYVVRKDGAYEVILPNGFEKIEQEAEQALSAATSEHEAAEELAKVQCKWVRTIQRSARSAKARTSAERKRNGDAEVEERDGAAPVIELVQRRAASRRPQPSRGEADGAGVEMPRPNYSVLPTT